jgi:CRISPR system Cascade subunit CasB
MGQPTNHELEFVKRLESLVETKEGKPDLGALASLRRGLGKSPGSVYLSDRYVLPFIPADSKFDELPFYLVAALFGGWYQGQEKLVHSEGNLGDSLRRTVQQEKSDDDRNNLEERLEKRLIALLNCHRDDLPDHLRQIISLLKSRDIPLDWAQLLHDIRGWNYDSRSVQHSWAQGFWIVKKEDTFSKIGDK